MVNTTMTIEQVERKKAEIEIPEKQDRYGVIKIIATSPPYKPELRLSFTPFEKTDKKDKRHSRNSYTSSYILTTKESVKLLSASFRKAADMLDESAGNLPSMPVIFTKN